LSLLNRFLKNTHISNFIKIHTVGSELFHADRWRGRQTVSHDKANICFCNFTKTPKMAQDGDRWWAVVPAVMNLLVP
jgi:hypothetical protein